MSASPRPRATGAELQEQQERERIQELMDQGALFVLNHSAGKDSQAQTLEVIERLRAAGIDGPQLLSRVLIVHADLGRVEWPGNLTHIKRTCAQTLSCKEEQVPLIVAHAQDKQGQRKELLKVVQQRGKWPDAARRWCTSDFKRGPIEREVKRYIKAKKLSGLVVSCLGLRAQESPARAKKAPLSYSESNSKAGRRWFEWLPIFRWSTKEVFARIAAAGQKPHWAYQEGMTRLSCSFCIFASRSDFATARRLRPMLFEEYAQLEERISHTFSMSRKPLRELVREQSQESLQLGFGFESQPAKT